MLLRLFCKFSNTLLPFNKPISHLSLTMNINQLGFVNKYLRRFVELACYQFYPVFKNLYELIRFIEMVLLNLVL